MTQKFFEELKDQAEITVTVIQEFDKLCESIEHTDIGTAWDIMNAIADRFQEILERNS